MKDYFTKALESEIRRIPRLGKQPWLPMVSEYLENGADPNSPPLLGNRSIMMLALDVDFPLPNDARTQLLSLLIEHGGNPFKHPALLTRLLEKNYYFLGSICKSLLKREHTNPSIPQGGGNVLHVLIENSKFVEELHWAIENRYSDIPLKWLHERNAAGQTILHVAWQHLDSTFLAHLWDLTTHLKMKAVLNEDFVDHEGITIRQCMMDRLESIDLSKVKDEYPSLCAEIEGFLISNATPNMDTATRPVRRI